MITVDVKGNAKRKVKELVAAVSLKFLKEVHEKVEIQCKVKRV